MNYTRIAFHTVFNLLIAVTLVFLVLRLAPGDPVERILGPEAKIEEVEKVRSDLGLDKSISSQYASFMTGILKGDLGESLVSKKPVVQLMIERIPSTIILASITITFSFLIGSMWGFLTGLKHNTPVDHLSRVLALMGLSFPIFSIAPFLVLVFAIYLQVLPVSEWGEARHVILPALTLIIPLSCVIARIARNRCLEEKSQLWIVVLQAKGLSKTQIAFRILKVCLPTLIHVTALQLSVVLAGTMVTESIFDIPGLGTLLLESIQNRDYPVVQGIVAYSTLIYVLVFLLSDVVVQWVDPRQSEVDS